MIYIILFLLAAKGTKQAHRLQLEGYLYIFFSLFLQENMLWTLIRTVLVR